MHRVELRADRKSIERARELRRNSTGPEKALWSVLRGGRIEGLRFRRQQPIGPYVADFYCEAARLVVELDGRSHDRREVDDAQRNAYMHRRGLAVLRISNDQALHNRAGVAKQIAQAALSRNAARLGDSASGDGTTR